MIRHFLYLFFIGFVPLQEGFALDPAEDLKSFSAFSKMDLRDPEEDKIWVEEGTSMDFSRGISGQACFLVMAPAEKTARLLQAYDGSSHESLRIYFHSPIHLPLSDKDFESLSALSDKSSFRRLVEKTQAIKPDQPGFYLSLAEARQIAERMKDANHPAEAAIHSWQEILKARVVSFQKNGLEGAAPYENGKMTAMVADEIQGLLGEDSKILKHFSPLLSATLYAKQPPKLDRDSYHYLELIDVDHRATFNLGAIYLMPSDNGYQMVDCTYYSSGGFYASCSLSQVWPIKVGTQAASLVWLGRMVSSESFADRKGIEAMAAPGVLLQEIKKWIRAFQEDLAKGKLSQ